jgi:dUTP pyrophosphatase
MGTIYIQTTGNTDLEKYYKSWDLHHEDDSGIDVPFPEEYLISLCETKLLPLNIRVMALDNSGDPIPLLLYPRSSIYKTPLMQNNSVGVIDSGYRGIVHAPVYYKLTDLNLLIILACIFFGVILLNIVPILCAILYMSNIKYRCKKDKPLFQICSPDLKPLKVEVVDILPNSDRGNNGFGSTNKKK